MPRGFCWLPLGSYTDCAQCSKVTDERLLSASSLQPTTTVMRKKGILNKIQKYCSVNSCKEKHYGKGFCLYHWRKQHGRCKLCAKHQSELTIRLCIEHNHVTGQVRGLTCHKCNIEIRVYELYRNNPKKIEIMEKYLNALPVPS